MTATPQEMHALVQVIRNVLHKDISVLGEERRKFIQYKDALINLTELHLPY